MRHACAIQLFTLAIALCSCEAVDDFGVFQIAGCDGGGAACGCESDADCQSSPLGPRCDPASRRCVQCLPEPQPGPEQNRCETGSTCRSDGAGGYRCVTGCTRDGDCPRLDGGALSCCGSVCADHASDENNCGACGHVCPAPPHARPACTSGACGIGGCLAGFADCNGRSSDGCEVDTAGDARNCGACGRVCPAIEHGSAQCRSGVCIDTCAAGYADCNGLATDGCEVDVTSDALHCGACGNACANSLHRTPTCVAGLCGVGACIGGYLDCDGRMENGCEVNGTTDVMNCGGCGGVCSLAQATTGCASGLCVVAACLVGYADCDGRAANGCEINVGSDVNNCAGCGARCALPNAIQACRFGACAVASCNAGFGDCDGQVGNGCEVNTNDDKKNCGRCRLACMMGEKCSNGVCG